jgi:uncharacterized protein YdeI (YjbR/CyaY-like superfamily)
MNAASAQRNPITPRSRQEWRGWLEENHASIRSVWVMIRKKNGAEPGVLYPEAVEEALCFGWVDGQTNRFDENYTLQYFAQRKPGSTWAKSNKQRVERLISEGRMTPAGMAKIEAAQKDGSWSSMDDIDALVIPEDLQAALAAAPAAEKNFFAFPPSARKPFLHWIASAKRPETREKRIAETIRRAALNMTMQDEPHA